MVIESKCVRCCVFVACALALALHLTGFISPGWLILKRDVIQQRATIFEGQLIDNGGMKAPEAVETDGRTKRSGEEEEEIEIVEEEVVAENDVVIEWFKQVTIETKEYEVRVSYGLWYATLCVHDKNRKRGDSDSSSDEDDDHRGKKGHCHCKKISIKCALYNSFIFEDPIDYINPGGPSRRVLSKHNFGYASLTEQRIENCISLAALVIGCISAFGAARKVNGCRCAAYVCILTMLVSAMISLFPVVRFGHYSVFKHKQPLPIHVGLPYSAFATGASAILCQVVIVLISRGLKKSRAERSGNWYKFNNELELPCEQEEKKPQLVFYTEPLPEKPDSDDI